MNGELIKTVTDGKLTGKGKNEITGICLDTRKNFPGSLFVALSGERFDGHDYIETALKSGSTGILWCEADRKQEIDLLAENYRDSFFVQTADTLKALGKVSEHILSEYRQKAEEKTGRKMPVVSVTGSVGKTTTKEFTAACLSAGYNVCKSEGNHNNEIGVPLTIMSLKDQNALVTEFGMRGQGQIEYLTDIVKPNVAIITNIGTAHLELLGSRSRIFMAKAEIAAGMRDGDTLIVNGDNDFLSDKEELAAYFKKVYGKNLNILTVGTSDKCDYAVSGYTEAAEHTDFLFTLPEGKTEKISIYQRGIHNALDGALALAAAHVLGINMADAAEKLRICSSNTLRQRIIQCKNGITVIDDTYNANPDSMRAALGVLGKYKTRRIAVLGDMLELGETSEEMHGEVGKFAAENADVLIATGKLSVFMGRAFEKEKGTGENVFYAENSDEAGKILLKLIKEKDTVLVKGSRSMLMEKAVAMTEEIK